MRAKVALEFTLTGSTSLLHQTRVERYSFLMVRTLLYRKQFYCIMGSPNSVTLRDRLNNIHSMPGSILTLRVFLLEIKHLFWLSLNYKLTVVLPQLSLWRMLKLRWPRSAILTQSLSQKHSKIWNSRILVTVFLTSKSHLTSEIYQ